MFVFQLFGVLAHDYQGKKQTLKDLSVGGEAIFNFRIYIVFFQNSEESRASHPLLRDIRGEDAFPGGP